MLSSAWFRFGLLLAALSLFAVAAPPAVGNQPLAYGRQLDAEYQLPPDTLARYAAMASGEALDESPRPNSMFADRSPWVGPPQATGVGRNPYTVVLTINAVAKTKGDADAQWQAGWQVYESPVASREVLLALPRVGREGLVAGQPLTLTTSSGHVSFRGERNVAPMLGLVQMHNLDIRDVQVQVWSGDAPMALNMPHGSRALLLTLAVAAPLIWLAIKIGSHAFPDRDGPSIRMGSRRLTDRLEPATTGPAQVTAAPATLSAEEQVVASLIELLTVGRKVDNVPDETRLHKRAPDAPELQGPGPREGH